MPAENPESIQHALSDSAQLLELLENEARALQENDITTLAGITVKKDALVTSLGRLGALRDQVRVSSHGASLRDLWQACQVQNRANGRIVERLFSFNRRTLAILHGQPEVQGIYRRDGRETTLAPSRYATRA